MNNDVLMVKCSIVRGGTSKAIFIMKNELPSDQALRDKIILAIFGSPSLRQLDGLGGADITTSKLAIIGPPTHPEADVDYTFGQVSMDEAFIDYGGNCGNISSGVGPFAINNNMVVPTEPVTTVRIHLTNSGSILKARILAREGQAAIDGDCVIGGVPGTASPIEMDWSLVYGSSTGKLLPTGNVADEIEMDGRAYRVSVVDAGNIVIYLKAQDFSLTGTETPAQINGDSKLLGRIEKLRGLVCQRIGLVKNWEETIKQSPYQPFLTMVTEPAAYDTYTGEHVAMENIDLVARTYLMGSVVKAYPGTATANAGFAVRIKGSVPYELLNGESRAKTRMTLGHPTGTISFNSVIDEGSQDNPPKMKDVSFLRTARILMEGVTYVRKSVLK